VRHLPDGDNFHRAKLTLMYDGRFAAKCGRSTLRFIAAIDRFLSAACRIFVDAGEAFLQA